MQGPRVLKKGPLKGALRVSRVGFYNVGALIVRIGFGGIL